MGRQFEKMFDQLIMAGLGLMLLLVPLVMSSRTSSNFAFPKLILLLIGTVIVTSFWIVKLLLSAELQFKLGTLEIAAIIFFGLVLTSFILSVNYSTSLIGDYTRFEGLFTYLSYICLFIVASQFEWNNKRIRYLALSLVAVAALISLIGILQYFGYDLISLSAQFDIHRSSGTFGNPSLLAGYLVLVFPVALALFIIERDAIISVLLGSFALSIFAATLTSFTRGGWIAIVLTTVIFFIWKRDYWSKKKAKIIAIIVMMLTLILLLITHPSITSTETSFIGRLKSVTQPSSGSLGTRWEIWRGSLRVVGQRPFFGSGPDTFSLVFPQHKSVKLTAAQKFNELNDNAHNYPLQLAVTLGVPASLIFIFIFIKSLLVSDKGLDEDSSPIYLGLLIGALGYMVTILFEVAVVGTTFIIWIILGIAASFSRHRDVKFSLTLSGSVRQVGIGLVVVVSIITTTFIARVYIADTYFKSGKNFLAAGNYSASVAAYRQAINTNPNFNEYYQGLAGVYAAKRENLNSSADIQLEMDAFNSGIKNNPYRLENYLGLAKADIFAATRFKYKRDFSEAKDLIDQALKLSPNSAPAYYNRATLNYYQADYNQSAIDFGNTVVLSPKYAPAYYGLGLAYKKSGRDEQALKAFKKTILLDENFDEAKKELRELGR